jgi:hypothetical protein
VAEKCGGSTWVQVIGQDAIMESLTKLKTKNDSLIRYVIDCSTLKA